jgi:hypothetical protein
VVIRQIADVYSALASVDGADASRLLSPRRPHRTERTDADAGGMGQIADVYSALDGPDASRLPSHRRSQKMEPTDADAVVIRQIADG